MRGVEIVAPSIPIQPSAVVKKDVIANTQAMHNNHSLSFVVKAVTPPLPSASIVLSTKMHTNTIGLMALEYQRNHRKICVPTSSRTEPGILIIIIAAVLAGINKRKKYERDQSKS